MHTEKISLGDRAMAGMIAANGFCEPMDLHGRYVVEAFDADGNLKWREEIDNLVTTAGKNAALDQVFSGTAFGTAYMGLVDGGSTPTYAAGDIMSSHAGWTENTGYSNGTRPQPTWNSAASGSKATTATAFNINATVTIAGVFIATNSTKGGTTGTLYSCGSFSGNRSLISGDTLNVTYTASA